MRDVCLLCLIGCFLLILVVNSVVLKCLLYVLVLLFVTACLIVCLFVYFGCFVVF